MPTVLAVCYAAFAELATLGDDVQYGPERKRDLLNLRRLHHPSRGGRGEG